MKLGIETLFQMLFLCGAVFCLIAFMGMNQYILDGRRTLNHAIDQIEISANREKTLESCVKKAKKKGYVLTGEAFDLSHPDYMLLTLSYEIRYKDMNLFKGAVQGYVR